MHYASPSQVSKFQLNSMDSNELISASFLMPPAVKFLHLVAFNFFKDACIESSSIVSRDIPGLLLISRYSRHEKCAFD